ncbi:uncharacterized protein [Diabrotica undecimpunctata]|uniref:uncharacterized protein n=1 Tax=Diabrotica undecimpunctata TaxID=50387 RepID=UPI003B636AFB
MRAAVDELIEIGAVSPCNSNKKGFLSSFFLVPKSSGGNRFVLNLKRLNSYITAPHFKLDDYRSVKSLITPGCYMVSLDLKDAYFGIPINKQHRKFLKFQYNGKMFQFNVLPFGLSVAPYLFTKILKPVTQYLKVRNILILNYLDDCLLLGSTKLECINNLKITIELFLELGFIINYKKSTLIPTQQITFLGFIFNSVDMSLSLTQVKITNTITIIRSILKFQACKIRRFARIIGSLISICPAVKYGYLYTKVLKRKKYLALKRESGDYNRHLLIDNDIRTELQWWISAIPQAKTSLQQSTYQMIIYSDASLSGWGACCDAEKIHGFWSEDTKKFNINHLELLAAYMGLKSFAKHKRSCSILLRIDNTTAISYINKMGGIKYPKLAYLARCIWQWCETRDILIFASYIESKSNSVADAESRSLTIDTEYSLNQAAYNQIVETFGKPQIDLFASISNTKCPKYVSWKKDPDSFAIDAFTLNWNNYKFYAFPPFSLVMRVLNKIILDKAEGIVVVPLWEAQCWYPVFLKLLKFRPILFKPKRDLMLSPFNCSHPIWSKITLVAGIVSGERT